MEADQLSGDRQAARSGGLIRPGAAVPWTLDWVAGRAADKPGITGRNWIDRSSNGNGALASAPRSFMQTNCAATSVLVTFLSRPDVPVGQISQYSGKDQETDHCEADLVPLFE